MLLIGAIAVLGMVVVAGLWLAGRLLMGETPKASPRWVGLLHGLAGALGLALLLAALRGPSSAHAVRMGAGAFAAVAAALLGCGLAAGLAILATRSRWATMPTALVATHGLLGVAGYTLLVTYLTMLR